MTKNKTKLQKEINKLKNQLADIEIAEKQKKNESFIGKFFKCQNSYSHSDKESDYWWLYSKVDGLDEYGNPKATNVQIDKDGNINVEFNKWVSVEELLGQETTEKEWLKAVDNVKVKMLDLER